MDVLFRSVAQSYGANVLAVVLTGMGSGRHARVPPTYAAPEGEVIVQDEASSVVWGMPGSVVAANLADRIYPLAGIGAGISAPGFDADDRLATGGAASEPGCAESLRRRYN